MKMIDHNDFIDRKCPICDNATPERVEVIDGVVIGVENKHKLYANLVVCPQCGLIYNNPTIKQDEYDDYYNDYLSVFEPESSYSINNRIELIKKYSNGCKRIAEIGGNEQGLFKSELEDIFEEYVSYDVGMQYKNTVQNIEDIGNVDIVVAYYVLEHVLDLDTFLNNVHGMLNNGGIVIFEVPDANKYYRDDTGLLALEHVSHFTPMTMTKLMQRYGFNLLEITRSYTSRDEGFVGVFEKSKKQIKISFDKNDYLLGQSIIHDGMRRYHSNEQRLELMCEKIQKPLIWGGGAAFWCANDVLRNIIDCVNKHGKTFDAIIIDEDPRKRNYYDDYYANTSKDLLIDGRWNQIKEIYICSEIRVDSILGTINEYEHSGLKVCFIDKNWSINDISFKLR